MLEHICCVSLYTGIGISHFGGIFLLVGESMKKVVFVDELNLTEKLKRLLKENGIFVLEDLILYLPEFLQEQFDLTIEDWKSILEVFIENHCAPSNLNSTICAAIKKRD